MYIEYATQFLVDKGILDERQAERVHQCKNDEKLPIGTLAANVGIMTPGQVEEARQMQRERDVFFGEAAVSLGFLDADQLAILLKMQSSDDTTFIKILMEEKMLELDDVVRWRSQFLSAHGLSEDDHSLLAQEDISAAVRFFGRVPEDSPFHPFAVGFLRAAIRFLDRNCYIMAAKDKPMGEQIAFTQNLTLDGETFWIGCEASEDACVSIAALLEGHVEAKEEGDALMHFMNQTTGIIILGYEGFAPGRPKRQTDPQTLPGEIARLAVQTRWGRMDVFMGAGNIDE